LSEQARRQLEKTSTKFEDLSLGDRRPTQLIRRYGNLYTEGRLDALDALDDVTEMTEFTDLKGKLLLTILVVGFTWDISTLNGLRRQGRDLAQPTQTAAAVRPPRNQKDEQKLTIFVNIATSTVPQHSVHVMQKTSTLTCLLSPILHSYPNSCSFLCITSWNRLFLGFTSV